MKILHTSDFHLSEQRRVTLDALEQVLKTGKELQIDLLTIGGDLFDSDRDAEVLRPRLRETFQGNDFDIIAIPGNHDKQIYARNLDFGKDLKIATGSPFSTYPYDNVQLIALPYLEKADEQLLNDLKNAEKNSEIRILLLHCTLDIGFASFSFGEENTKHYFPITKETLVRLGYDFILAGHFHTQPYRLCFNNGCHFLYPGSPVSLSQKELGKRQGFLIDTNSKNIESVSFHTFYYDTLEVNVKPGQEKQEIEHIAEWVSKKSADNCSLKVVINGFIQMPELEFRETLGEFGENVTIDYGYKDVQHVLAHPLFRRFKENLDVETSIQNEDQVIDLVLETFSELLVSRQLRI